MAPNTSMVIKKLCDKYLDSNALQVIEGGIEVAVPINKLKLDLICFTGSTTVGKIIAKTAAENLTPCILELGGKCPTIVDFNADVAYASKKIAYTATTNSGQICVRPDYMLVHESKVKDFIQGLKDNLR